MIDSLTALVTSKAAVYSGAGAAGVGLAWVLKKIPNDAIKDKVGKVMYGAGVACTLGLSKWSATKKVWNKVVEPWFIDLLDNVIVTGLKKFISGLRSDR
tara:strand:- start:1380 stop:1676 length:297 start_codon:yes stop_codon:yes gene_type:complete